MPSENEIEAAMAVWNRYPGHKMAKDCMKMCLEAAEKVRAEEKRALELEKIFIHDACEQLAKGDK